MDIFQLFISAIFVNNIVLAQYLGQCPYLGCSKDKSVAYGMSGAVVFVTIMASALTWIVSEFFLRPFNIEYLQTIFFILLIASLVQFVEMFMKKMLPPLYASLGIFLPLISSNCAVMGVALMVQREGFSFFMAITYALASSSGFGIAIVVLAAIRERLDTARMPKSLAGTPIGLIMAGLMSLSFMAFKGMI